MAYNDVFTLKQCIIVNKIRNKTPFVKELGIQEGDELIISLRAGNTQYARQVTVYNPRTDKSKNMYLNIFLTSICAITYTQKY